MSADRVTSGIDAFREAALHCPIPPAVELIGEKWAFLILRGALNGLQHFEEFQAGLDIARNILSDRLAKLVAGGPVQNALGPAGELLLSLVFIALVFAFVRFLYQRKIFIRF